MSKGNILLGYARGKVGDLVFVRRGGEQIVRPYVGMVKNPQTRPQMVQRIKWPNLVAAWRVLKPYIQMGMQDKKPSQSDYNAFISRNLANNTAYLLKEEVKQGAMLVAPYILTSGSLGLCSMDTAKFSSIRVGDSIDLSSATIGEVTASIIENNTNYAVGDQVTFIVLGQVITGGVPSVVPAAYKFVLAELTDNTPFADAVAVYGSIEPAVEGGLLGYDFADVTYQGYGAACIHSRLSASGVLELSTSAIHDFFNMSIPLGQSTPFGVSKEEALNSYGYNPAAFLYPSPAESSGPDTSLRISSITLGGKELVDGQEITLNSNDDADLRIEGFNLVASDISVMYQGNPVALTMVSDRLITATVDIQINQTSIVVTWPSGSVTTPIRGTF